VCDFAVAAAAVVVAVAAVAVYIDSVIELQSFHCVLNRWS